MQKIIIIVCLIIACAILSTPAFTQRKTPKAVFIIIDGVPADVLERLDPPTLKEISETGGYMRAYQGGMKGGYNETPTISAPGYNNILTGVWANKHNVRDNNISAPNYSYWNIFRVAKNSSPKLKTAVFSTWEDNRTKLVGENLPDAGKIRLNFSFDGLEHDSVTYPHDKTASHIKKIDDAVSTEAARVIRKNGPDLSWVYLEYTDDMGHQHGDSPQLDSAVMDADRYINKVWTAMALRESAFNEDWLIVVTTDHGRDPDTGKKHGGQSDRERTTWIVTNSDQLNARFPQTPAAVDIFPSICNHLGLNIPESMAQELDGVPFIGPVDLSDLKGVNTNGKITLTWTSLVEVPIVPMAIGTGTKAEIFVAVTNKFAKGDEDRYVKVGETFTRQGKFTFSLRTGSAFLKVLVKGPHHYVNTWVIGGE